VTAAALLTLTPANFATPQNVTITGRSPQARGVATFTATGTG